MMLLTKQQNCPFVTDGCTLLKTSTTLGKRCLLQLQFENLCECLYFANFWSKKRRAKMRKYMKSSEGLKITKFLPVTIIKCCTGAVIRWAVIAAKSFCLCAISADNCEKSKKLWTLCEDVMKWRWRPGKILHVLRLKVQQRSAKELDTAVVEDAGTYYHHKSDRMLSVKWSLFTHVILAFLTISDSIMKRKQLFVKILQSTKALLLKFHFTRMVCYFRPHFVPEWCIPLPYFSEK